MVQDFLVIPSKCHIFINMILKYTSPVKCLCIERTDIYQIEKSEFLATIVKILDLAFRKIQT